MDTTTLLIIVLIIVLLGGGWYGRGRCTAGEIVTKLGVLGPGRG